MEGEGMSDERWARIENALWHAEQVRPPTVATATARQDLASLRTRLASAEAVVEAARADRCPQCGVWIRDMKSRPDSIGSALSTYDKAPG